MKKGLSNAHGVNHDATLEIKSENSLSRPSLNLVVPQLVNGFVQFIVSHLANLGKQFIVSSALISYTTKWGHTTTGTWGIWSGIGSLNHGPYRPPIVFDCTGYLVRFVIVSTRFFLSPCLVCRRSLPAGGRLANSAGLKPPFHSLTRSPPLTFCFSSFLSPAVIYYAQNNLLLCWL